MIRKIPMWRRYLTFWGRDIDRDLEAELDFHIEARKTELIDEGWSPVDARRKAERLLGNVQEIHDECAGVDRLREVEMRRADYLEQLRQDVGYALRGLRRSPGFAIVAIVTLALGIGANAAIFSVVNAVLLKPLPYATDDVYTLWQQEAGGALDYTEVSPANFLDWHAESESFEWLAAASPFSFGYTEQGRSIDVEASMVSDGFFETLGVPALIGRTFFESEYVAGRNRAFVISHGLWLRMFGADPAIIGSDVTFDGTPITIIGVMPPEFQFPNQEVEIWAPLVRQTYMPQQRASTYWRVVGKLAEGVTPAQAQTEMDALGADLARRYPESNEGVGIDLRPLREHLVGDVRQPLLVLLAAVGFVLLIACSNVACLMLMRGSQREQEFAVRTAVGAGRMRLVRQLVVESLVLAIAGGGGGLALAAGVQRILPLVSPSGFPRLEYMDLDATVLMFTAAIATGSALIAGLFPLVRVFGPDVQARLKEGRRTTTAGRSSRRLGSALVASEVALAIVLLVGAGLLAQSFINLVRVDPGFDSRNALTMELHIWDSYPAPDQQVNFFDELFARLRALPGTRAVGAASTLPSHDASQEMERIFTTESEPAESSGHSAFLTIATDGYFEAVGTPIVEGRSFTRFDGADSNRVAIITESLATRYWESGPAVGGRIRIADGGELSIHEIVGIIPDARHTGLDVAPRAEIFVPQRQNPFGSMMVVLRTDRDPLALAEAAQEQVWAIQPDQSVGTVATLGQLIDRTLGTRRFYLVLIGLFAVIALALASVGIYGVVSYATFERTPELGVRIAFGARSADILRLVVWQGLGMVLLGIGLGLLMAIGLTRFLEELLFDVSTLDPVTFGMVALLLTGVALLASYLPARRAIKVDPLQTLRSE